MKSWLIVLLFYWPQKKLGLFWLCWLPFAFLLWIIFSYPQLINWVCLSFINIFCYIRDSDHLWITKYYKLNISKLFICHCLYYVTCLCFVLFLCYVYVNVFLYGYGVSYLNIFPFLDHRNILYNFLLVFLLCYFYYLDLSSLWNLS